MAIPSMNITIQDFALGIAPANINAVTKFGFSSGGKRGVLAGFTDAQTMKASHGVGPIVDAAAHLLAVAGGTVYLFPIVPAIGWGVGGGNALTRSGPGPGTIQVIPAIWRKTIIRYLLGGALATATFQISLDNGVTFLPDVYTTAATVQLDHNMTQVTFNVGTYVAGDTATFNTDGTISATGTSPAPTSSASQSAPVDKFGYWVKITKAGGLGAAEFQYSLDGGTTLSAVFQVPAGGKFVVPNAGFYFLFASTFTLNDTFTDPSNLIPPNVLATGDITANMPALLANQTEWDHVHIVNTWTNATAAATAATTAGVQMSAAQAAFRYAYAIVDCPTEGIADATVAAAFVAVSELRVEVGAGDGLLASSLYGLSLRKPASWTSSARAALTPVGEDSAWVGRGALPGVLGLFRDEGVTPQLDAARLTTQRTHIGIPGFYLTNSRMMSPPGSDFQFRQHRRVMDRACRTARTALLPFLNGGLRVDASTGRILEEDAGRIEARANAMLAAVLVDTGNASAVRVLIDRNNNILSTNTLKVTVRVTPLGYMKTIEVDIGFENPALLQAA